MAAPVSSQRPQVNPTASGPSTPRWTRNGEPGSAFSGLSRGGRGRGNPRGQAGRGGRGGASSREAKPKADSSSVDKVETNEPKIVSTPSAAPKPLPSATLAQEKPSAHANSPSKARTSSRRPSKSIPALVVAAQASPSTDAPPSPASARSQHRRRRSQSGKAIANPLPKINPPAHDDNLLRPNRARLGPVPHSAPIKDAPPHLPNSFDMKNNIDALVERVRAVAMADNRPSTPGSHIDWAGDEDDSLPDLDDWGVTPSTTTGGNNHMMSPIVVDGLRSLPEPIVKPLTPSPLQKEEPLPLSPKVESATPINSARRSFGSSKPSSSPRQKLSTRSERGKPRSHGAVAPNGGLPGAQPQKPAAHPSLPQKPSTGAENGILAKSRHGAGASPGRNTSPPTQPPVTISKTSPLAAPPIEASELAEQPAEAPAPEPGLAQSIHAASAPDLTDVLLPNAKPREGLTASIHAPQNLLESVSAPSDLASLSPPAGTRTHTRAHTLGRPFPDQRGGLRVSRSGQTTPHRGISPGSHHARTHSTPPPGTLPNPRTSRPVLTGDALSRIAKTIGNTTATPRAAVAAAHD